MKVEIHVRPMILPKLAGTPASQNKCEVDVWFYLRDDGVGEVSLETVCDTPDIGNKFAKELQEALKSVQIIFEE